MSAAETAIPTRSHRIRNPGLSPRHEPKHPKEPVPRPAPREESPATRTPAQSKPNPVRNCRKSWPAAVWVPGVKWSAGSRPAIAVNGKIATLGDRVDDRARIAVDGKPLERRRRKKPAVFFITSPPAKCAREMIPRGGARFSNACPN